MNKTVVGSRELIRIFILIDSLGLIERPDYWAVRIFSPFIKKYGVDNEFSTAKR